MDMDKSRNLMQFARRTSPDFVRQTTSKGCPKDLSITFSFLGRPDSLMVARILSFQGSLKTDFNLCSQLYSLKTGCVEATLKLESEVDTKRLFDLIKERKFDRLAYTYLIIAAKFNSKQGLPEFRFHADSFYR